MNVDTSPRYKYEQEVEDGARIKNAHIWKFSCALYP